MKSMARTPTSSSGSCLGSLILAGAAIGTAILGVKTLNNLSREARMQTLEPIAAPAPDGLAGIVFDSSTGMGCQRLYKATGAKGAGVAYSDFISYLDENNGAGNALDFYSTADGGLDCNITASPAFGNDKVDGDYISNVPVYLEWQTLDKYVDEGVARIMH